MENNQQKIIRKISRNARGMLSERPKQIPECMMVGASKRDRELYRKKLVGGRNITWMILKNLVTIGEIMEAVDKVDSGNLTVDEVMNPAGWILVGFLMDPRTGLGRWRQFSISNYQLMEKLLEACRTMTTEEILALPDVQERIEVYNEQTEKFREMVLKYTRVDGNVIISDLRGVDPIYTGNRFMIYSMYPEQNISAWIVSGRGGKGCSAAVGYSILNRTSNVDVGKLMLKYNGGGHRKVGTCQFTDEEMEEKMPAMLAELCAMANQA